LGAAWSAAAGPAIERTTVKAIEANVFLFIMASLRPGEVPASVQYNRKRPALQNPAASPRPGTSGIITLPRPPVENDHEA
jgi:hypothetical protein